MSKHGEAVGVRTRAARLRAWLGSVSRLETSIVLRAVTITLIVCMHTGLIELAGSSAVLLVVLGFNLARFQLADLPGANRSRRLLRTAGQIAIPAVLWAGLTVVFTDHYQATTALLVNGFVSGGGDVWTDQWELWFIEIAVWTMLGLAALFAIPAIDRLERRAPFGFALVLLAIALPVRYVLTDVDNAELDRYVLTTAFWFIMLGWAAARARTWRGRLLISAVAAAVTPVFAIDDSWDLVALLGILILLWVPWVPVPRPLVGVVWTLAGASLFIYLIHWQVYIAFENPYLGVLASLVAGIAAWLVYRFVSARLSSWFHRRTSRGRGPSKAPGLVEPLD